MTCFRRRTGINSQYSTVDDRTVLEVDQSSDGDSTRIVDRHTTNTLTVRLRSSFQRLSSFASSVATGDRHAVASTTFTKSLPAVLEDLPSRILSRPSTARVQFRGEVSPRTVGKDVADNGAVAVVVVDGFHLRHERSNETVFEHISDVCRDVKPRRVVVDVQNANGQRDVTDQSLLTTVLAGQCDQSIARELSIQSSGGHQLHTQCTQN